MNYSTARAAKGKRRSREVFMLVAMRDDGSVFLERGGPATGIWGGLWCLPSVDTVSAASSYAGKTLEARKTSPTLVHCGSTPLRTSTWSSRRC